MSTLEERARAAVATMNNPVSARIIHARLRMGDPTLIRYWRICTLWSDVLGSVNPHPPMGTAQMHWFPYEGGPQSNNGWTACGGNIMGSTSWQRAVGIGVLSETTRVHICCACAKHHQVREDAGLMESKYNRD